MISIPTLTVHTRPSCAACRLTIRRLEREAVTYRSVDAAGHLDHLRALGISQAPGVTLTRPDGVVLDAWGGWRPDRLDAAIAVIRDCMAAQYLEDNPT